MKKNYIKIMLCCVLLISFSNAMQDEGSGIQCSTIMSKSFNPAKRILAEPVKNILETMEIHESIEEIEKQIDIFPVNGQMVLKVFKYTGIKNETPEKICSYLSEKLEEHCKIPTNSTNVLKASVDNEKLVYNLLSFLNEDGSSLLPLRLVESKKVLIEHSQPNTHKELHIGHMRNTVLGDTLCNMFRFMGYEVWSENYYGDEGAHVAKCLWYMDKHQLKPTEEEDKGTWLGKIYTQANIALESDGDNKELNNQQISKTLEHIEKKSGDLYEKWLETREWSLELFRKSYKWLNVDFDRWTSESDVSEEAFSIVHKYYEDGIFTSKSNTIGTAIGADLSHCNLGFYVLLKSDGRGLYSSKDVALALRRSKQFDADKYIYVVDVRQSFHFKQLFATLELMGLEKYNQFHHLAYELVNIPEGTMSSRKGTIVPLLKLIEGVESSCREKLESTYHDQWPEEEIKNTARNIAIAAIRYGMIRISPEKKITFNMKDWLRSEGNTGYYLLYSYSRIQSLLRKAMIDVDVRSATIKWNLLDSPKEKDLLLLMSGFYESAQWSVDNLKPSIFSNYLFNFAQSFNALYGSVQILSEEDFETKNARIALVKLCSAYMGSAFNLLGLPTIQRM
jgi:arginyl-tRNA synthetase